MSQQLHGARLAEVAHLHLSPFKDSTGAFRLLCRTTQGAPWTVIFKDARYDHFDGAVLASFPIAPGPPEHAVYASADGPLRTLLPLVYHCVELSPDRHYQYVLEDVSATHRKPVQPADILQAVGSVDKIGRAIRQWAVTTEQNGLISYDQEYCSRLADFAGGVLDRFLAVHATNTSADSWSHWPTIRHHLTRKEFHEYAPATGVHGDLNRASLLLGDTVPQFKVIDWEWSGLGLPHSDLALLLERADVDLVRSALSIYSAAHPELPAGAHERLFHWARMQMCVKNAAFLAAQVLDARTVTRRDRVAYVHGLLARAADSGCRL